MGPLLTSLLTHGRPSFFSNHNGNRFPEAAELKESLASFAARKLNRKQKYMLLYIYRIGEYRSLTSLARRISEERGIPLSTVKWNLKELRDLKLIRGGDSKNRKEKVRLTGAGLIAVKSIITERVFYS